MLLLNLPAEDPNERRGIAFRFFGHRADTSMVITQEVLSATDLIETPSASPGDVGESADSADANARERQGRRWLIWSFVFCPCHLPLSMAVLAAVFGTSAFGALISRNTIGVGIVFGLIYAVGVGIGFKHLRAAAKDKNCGAGVCEV